MMHGQTKINKLLLLHLIGSSILFYVIDDARTNKINNLLLLHLVGSSILFYVIDDARTNKNQ